MASEALSAAAAALTTIRATFAGVLYSANIVGTVGSRRSVHTHLFKTSTRRFIGRNSQNTACSDYYHLQQLLRCNRQASRLLEAFGCG